MTESAARWLTREALVLAALFGLLLSAALYVIGFGLASVDALTALAGRQLPALLRTVGGWGLAVFLAGEGVLLVSSWLLRLSTHPDDGRPGGQKGQDAA
jgi:hypothetical protein